jgi:hypothetical protein
MAEILLDPSIESAGGNWYDFWTEYGPGGQTHSWDTVEKHSGTHSFKLVSASTAYDGGRRQGGAENSALVLLPAGEYYFSGWIKTGANVDNAHCVIQRIVGYTEMAGGHITTPNQDWTQVGGQFTSDGTSEYVILFGLGSYGATSDGTAWFDDISLTLLSNPYTSPFPSFRQ